MIITLKREGTCAECGKTLKVGERANWWRSAGEIRCTGHKDTRSYAEQIEAKKERAERRHDWQTERAGRLTTEADSRYNTAHKMMEIMQGEPVKVGHHSEGRHRRDIERVDNNMRKAFQGYEEAKEAAYKAEATIKNIEHMEQPDVTKRRIEKFETEKRKLLRNIADSEEKMQQPTWYNWKEGRDVPVDDNYKAQHTRYIERLRSDIAEIQEKIDYWQQHLKDTGAEFYGPSDFKKGDKVMCRHGVAVVERANPKTLSVRYIDAPLANWAAKYGYEEIKGKAAK